MSVKRLSIRGLRIAGEKREQAEVSFSPGLNVIVGASDTGKTFVFEALDFMLGASGPMRRIPESEGYDRIFLDVEPSDNPMFTVRRAFDGGDVEVQEFGEGRDHDSTNTLELSTKHSENPEHSLSAYLLDRIGLGGRFIRKNQRGEKSALSFRHVSDLTFISEERIIHQGSPILSGQYTEGTREENLFGFFLTGQDDSQIISQESPQKRNARLDAEASVVQAIIEERRANLAQVSKDSSDLSGQTARIQKTIDELSTTVVTSQDEISQLESERNDLFNERVMKSSRLGFLNEQLKRLRLLDDYYRTDVQRLQAVLEASHVFHELPEGICPLCKQAVVVSEDDHKMQHSDFEAACEREIAKIAILRTDLGKAISDCESENTTESKRLEEIGTRLKSIEGSFAQTLMPAVRAAKTDLQIAIQTRMTLVQAESLKTEVENLTKRLDELRAQRKQKVAKLEFDSRASTSAAFDFCKVIEELLKAWKYPRLGTVSFDSEKCDLVIGGQDRASKGKGYRAVTYAAFSIGLMKYCRSKGIPHPGFVVLDTPLNPFKGPKSESADDTLTNEVKVAFYEYLANDDSGDQVIILENEEPPDDVRKRIKYYSFTGNPKLGRFGLFPPR